MIEIKRTFLTVKESAGFMGTNTNGIYHLIRTGKLKTRTFKRPTKRGRGTITYVRLDSVHRLLKKQA